MLRTRLVRLLGIAALLIAGSSVHYPAAAVEVCGDGADNDSNSLVDEGCYSTAVLDVCESPLSCGIGGAVAPKSGALVYHVMSDLTPKVAYGPGITFTRFYTSQYDPGYFGGSVSDYRDSLGYRWQHNWMSWLEKFTTPSPDEVVLHTTTGQDVLFKYSTNDGTYDKYTPQAVWHFDYLRQKTASGAGQYDWELRTLTGEVFVYDGSGTGNHVAKLIELRDTLATPNKVTITYNGDGKVDQVKDATTTKYLQLEYFTTGTKLLRYVKYYTGGGSPDVTVEFTYSSDKLASALIGGTTVESYGYGSGSYLESVTDGGSKTVLRRQGRLGQRHLLQGAPLRLGDDTQRPTTTTTAKGGSPRSAAPARRPTTTSTSPTGRPATGCRPTTSRRSSARRTRRPRTSRRRTTRTNSGATRRASPTPTRSRSAGPSTPGTAWSHRAGSW